MKVSRQLDGTKMTSHSRRPFLYTPADNLDMMEKTTEIDRGCDYL